MAKPLGNNKLNNIIKKLLDPNYAKNNPTLASKVVDYKTKLDSTKGKPLKGDTWKNTSKELETIGNKIPNIKVPTYDDLPKVSWDNASTNIADTTYRIANTIQTVRQKERDNYNHFYNYSTTAKIPAAQLKDQAHLDTVMRHYNGITLGSESDRINALYNKETGSVSDANRLGSLEYSQAMLDPEKTKAIARYLSPGTDFDISQIRDKYPELQPYVDSMKLVNDMFSGTYGYGLKQKDIDDWYKENTYKRKIYDSETGKWNTETVFKADAVAPPLCEDKYGNKIDQKKAAEAWAFYVAYCDTNYNISANIAIQNAKASEEMAYTAGVNPDAVDSYLDVVRNTINGKTTFLQGSKDYFKNYVWNPLSEGNFKKLAINTLVNLGETLDYAGVALRAGLSTVDQVGGTNGLVEGGDVWWSSDPLVSKTFQAKVVELGWLQYADTEVHAKQFAEKLLEKGYSEAVVERWLAFASDYQTNYLGQHSSFKDIGARIKNAYTSTEANYLYNTGSTLADAMLYMVDPSLLVGGVAKATAKEGTKLVIKSAVEDALKTIAKNDADAFIKRTGMIVLPNTIKHENELSNFIKSVTSDKYFTNINVLKSRADTFVRQLELSGAIWHSAVPDVYNAVCRSLATYTSTSYSKFINSVYKLGKGIDVLDSTLLKSVLGVPYSSVKLTQGLYKAARKTTVVQSATLTKWMESNVKAQAIFGNMHTSRNIGNLDEYLNNAETMFAKNPIDEFDGLVNKSDIENFTGLIRQDVARDISYLSEQVEFVKSLAKNKSISSSQAVNHFNKLFERITNGRCTTYEEIIPYFDDLFSRHQEQYSGLLDDLKGLYKSQVDDINRIINMCDSNAVMFIEEAVRTFTRIEDGDALEQQIRFLESKGFTFRPETKQLLEQRLDEALLNGRAVPLDSTGVSLFKESSSKKFKQSKSLKDSIGNVFGKTTISEPALFDNFKESYFRIVDFNEFSDIVKLHAVQELYNYLKTVETKSIDIIELQHYVNDATSELLLNSVNHPGELKNLKLLLDDFSNSNIVKINDESRIMKLHMDHYEVLNTMLSHPDTIKALKYLTDPTTPVGAIFNKLDNYSDTLIIEELKQTLSSDPALKSYYTELGDKFNNIVTHLRSIKNDVDALQYYQLFKDTIVESCELTEEQAFIVLDTVFGMSRYHIPESLNKSSYFMNKVLDKIQYSMDGAFGQSLSLDNFRKELLDFNSDFYGNYLKDLEPSQIKNVEERITKLCDNGHISPLSDTRIQMLQVILKDPDAVKEYNAIKESGKDVIFYDLETTGLNPNDCRIISVGYLNWEIVSDDADIFNILDIVEKNGEELHAPLSNNEVFSKSSDFYLSNRYLKNLFKDVKHIGENQTRRDYLKAYYNAYGDVNPNLTKLTEVDILEDFMIRADKRITPCFVSHSNNNFDRNVLFSRLHKVKSPNTNLSLFANTNWEDLVTSSRNSWQMLKASQGDVLLDTRQLELVSEAFIEYCKNTSLGGPNFRVYDNASILNSFKQVKRNVEELDSLITDVRDMYSISERGRNLDLYYAIKKEHDFLNRTTVVTEDNKEIVFKSLQRGGDDTIKNVLENRTVDSISIENLQQLSDYQDRYVTLKEATVYNVDEHCKVYNDENPLIPLDPVAIHEVENVFEDCENAFSDAIKSLYDFLNRNIDDSLTPEELKVFQGGFDKNFDIARGLFKKRMSKLSDALLSFDKVNASLLPPNFMDSVTSLRDVINTYLHGIYKTTSEEVKARDLVLYGDATHYSLQHFLETWAVTEFNYVNPEKAVSLVHAKFKSNSVKPILKKLPYLKLGDVPHIELVPTGVSDSLIDELVVDTLSGSLKDSYGLWDVHTFNNTIKDFPSDISGILDEDIKLAFVLADDYLNGDIFHDIHLLSEVLELPDVSDSVIQEYLDLRSNLKADIYNARSVIQDKGISNLRAISSDLNNILPLLRNNITDRTIAEHNIKIEKYNIANDFVDAYSDIIEGVEDMLDDIGLTVKDYVDLVEIAEKSFVLYDNESEFRAFLTSVPKDTKLEFVRLLFKNANLPIKSIYNLTEEAIDNTIVQRALDINTRLKLQEICFEPDTVKYIEKYKLANKESLTDILVKYQSNSELRERLFSEIISEKDTINSLEHVDPSFKVGVWDDYVLPDDLSTVPSTFTDLKDMSFVWDEYVQSGDLSFLSSAFVELKDMSSIWDAHKTKLRKLSNENFDLANKKGLYQVIPSRYMATYKKLSSDGLSLFDRATHFKGTDEELNQLITEIEEYQKLHWLFQTINSKNLGIEEYQTLFKYAEYQAVYSTSDKVLLDAVWNEHDRFTSSTTFPDYNGPRDANFNPIERIPATFPDDFIVRSIDGIKKDVYSIEASDLFLDELFSNIKTEDAPLYYLSKILPDSSYYFDKFKRVVLNKTAILEDGGFGELYTKADNLKHSLSLEEQRFAIELEKERELELYESKGVTSPKVSSIPKTDVNSNSSIISDLPNFGKDVNELYNVVHSPDFDEVIKQLKNGSEDTQQEMKAIITYFEDPYVYKNSCFEDTPLGKFAKDVFGEDSEKYSNLRKLMDNATGHTTGATEIFNTSKAMEYFKLDTKELPVYIVESMGNFTRKVEHSILSRLKPNNAIIRNQKQYTNFIKWVSEHANKLEGNNNWAFLKYLKYSDRTPQQSFAVTKVLYDDIFKYSDITYRDQLPLYNSIGSSNAGMVSDYQEFSSGISSYLTPIRVVERGSDVVKPYPVHADIRYDHYNSTQRDSDLLNSMFRDEIYNSDFRNLLDDEALTLLRGDVDELLFNSNTYSTADTYLERVSNSGYENAAQFSLMHDKFSRKESSLNTLLYESEQLLANPKAYKVNEALSRFTRILDKMSDIAKDSALFAKVSEHFNAVQSQRRRVFSEQILSHVTKSEDNLVSHLLFNHQILVVPLAGDELHKVRVADLHKLLKESSSEYLTWNVDESYIYVGINNKHRLQIANEGTSSTVINFEGFTKNYYRPHYSNIGFDTNILDKSFTDASVASSIIKELDNVYKELDFYSAGSFRGSLGVTHTANRQRKILSALPSDFKQNLFDDKYMFNEKLFNGISYDMCLLGDTENCFKITEFNETDLFLTTQHLINETAGRAQAERVYFNSLFGSANVNRFSKMFEDFSDEEILEALSLNKEYVVVSAKATNNTPSGIYIESLNMIDTLACNIARETNAVVVPYDVYLDMVNTYNHATAQTNTFLKLWSKAMLVMKVGHLANPGTWIRNWIDATTKASGDIGDFGTTARYQIQSLRKLYEYQKIVKHIEHERSVTYHSQLDIQRHWETYAAATGTRMTYEEFQFMEGWMQNGLSGGESSSMKALKKRMANYEGTNMGLKSGDRYSRNTIDDIPTRFRDLGENEVMKYYDELPFSELREYHMTRERFLDIFNCAECSLKEQRVFEQISNLIIKQRALSFSSAGFRMGRKFSKIFDVALSPMSGVEEVVRLGELLALQDKGYSYNRILQTISASQFNYDLKTMNARRLENVFLYYTFEKSNLIYWFRQLSENPSLLRAIEDLWGSLSWDASYDYVTDEEDPYGNNSLAYVMLNGGIPIGDSGLYLKTNPSFLSALNYYYGGPDAYLNAVAAPVELLAKTALSRMGFDYRSMFGSMSEEFMNEEVWKKVLSTVPIAGTIYDRTFAPRHVRDTWERALEYNESYMSAGDGFFRSVWRAIKNGDTSGALSATANYLAPSVFGVIKASHKYDSYSDFNAFREKLALQGKFYDCNSGKVLPIEEANEYGLNSPNISWDNLVRLKMVLTGKVWDGNKAMFVDPEDYEWGGLNRAFNTSDDKDWAELCQLKYDKLGLVWDANQASFVLPEDKIEGGLNQKYLPWEEKCYYMMVYRGLQWDNNQQSFVDKNHYISGGLNGNIKFGDALNEGYTSSASLEWSELAALKYALHGEVWDRSKHSWVKVKEPDVTFTFGEVTGHKDITKPNSTDNAEPTSVMGSVLNLLVNNALAETTSVKSDGTTFTKPDYSNVITGFDDEHNAKLFSELIAKYSGKFGSTYRSGWADGYHYKPKNIVNVKKFYPRFTNNYDDYKFKAYNMMYSYGSNDRTSRALSQGEPAYYQYYATGKIPTNPKSDWLARRTETLVKRERAMLKYHFNITDSANEPKSSAKNHLNKIKSIWYSR